MQRKLGYRVHLVGCGGGKKGKKGEGKKEKEGEREKQKLYLQKKGR